MNILYVFLPIDKAIAKPSPEFWALLESLCSCKVIDHDKLGDRNYQHIQISRDDTTGWIAAFANTTFASDPRTFTRIRVDGYHEKLVKELIEKAKELGGYYADNSKEFFDSKGKVIFDVEDGVTSLEISYGEVISRLHDVNPTKQEEELKGKSRDEYIQLFKDQLGIALSKRDNGQFTMQIPEQVTAV